MQTDSFDYPLPPSRIAQFPARERTASRLLQVGANLTAHRFADLRKLLRDGDLLVANDTRVVPARLFATKPSGGQVEILLERILDARVALVQLRSPKPIRARQKLIVAHSELVVRERREHFFVLDADADLAELFRAHGVTPLPPYIKRAADADDTDDVRRYQTVYSRADGAVAAPTAGLHFDRALIARLATEGVGWATVTLHIGAGTFQPVRAAAPAEHRMHREWIEVGASACAQINATKRQGGRIVAVGTTVVRALESAARACCSMDCESDESNKSNKSNETNESHDSNASPLQPFRGDTDLFILPGFRFRAVDALITNFHLPKSTLLMLVCAFAGTERVMRAYRHAVANDFRFYSYGDAMFVERERDRARNRR
ncbi:MAG: tRNA preQ1(34) S-adenosylmethionine ribosyltransferase-isomerase QueA [bacterium]